VTMRGGIYDKESGKEYQWPSQIMDHKSYDSEQLSYTLGELLDILLDKGVIDAQDVIYIIPMADRWYTTQKPMAYESELK
jgi:hypothetical protein